MKTRKITVVPYDPLWERAFEEIAAELEAALGSLALSVEHVGSTAVAGMSAKPCIDVDVVIESYAVFDEVVRRLALVGYLHEGDLGIREREAFCYTDKPHLALHHLYVCPKDSPELRRHIAFREFLKANPWAVREYSAIKEEAARLFPHDVERYIAYKSPCIEKLYRQCGLL